MFSQKQRNNDGIKQTSLNYQNTTTRSFSSVKQSNTGRDGSPRVRGFNSPKTKTDFSSISSDHKKRGSGTSSGSRGRNLKRDDAATNNPSKKRNFSTSPNKKRHSRAKSTDHHSSRVNQSKWKTELCRAFMENRCKHGEDCLFAHGKDDLRQVERPKKWKTELCNKFHTVGQCPYGSRCRFIHLETPFAKELFHPRPKAVKRLPVFDDLCTPASDDENELAGVTPVTSGKTLMMMELRHQRKTKVTRDVPRGLFDQFLRIDRSENMENVAPTEHTNLVQQPQVDNKESHFREWVQTELFDMVMSAVVDHQTPPSDSDHDDSNVDAPDE